MVQVGKVDTNANEAVRYRTFEINSARLDK